MLLSIVKYTVTFNVDGELTPVEVEENTKVAEQTAPTKDGYTFVGWYLGDEEYNFETLVTKDITLVAKWDKVIVKY